MRHHWAPQLLFEKTVEPSAPGNAFFQPDRTYHDKVSPFPDHHEEFKQREPRFLPSSAFLASPPPAALQIPASEPTRPVMTQNSPTKRSLVESPSRSAQEAVASASRAPAMAEANTADLEKPLFHLKLGSGTLSGPPYTQPPVCLQRQTPGHSHTMASLSSLLPITSPHVASPVLTPPPVHSSLSTTFPYRPVDDLTPNYVSAEPPQGFSKRSWISADIFRSSHPYSYGYGESPLPPLGTTVGPFSHPSVQPRRTMIPASLGPSRFDGVSRSLPWYKAPERSRNVEEFLKMGHGNPCWCSNHPNSVPAGELASEDDWARSKMNPWKNGSTPLPPIRPGDKLQPPIGTGRPKKSAEPVPTPRSSSPPKPGPEIEELTRSVREAFMPGSDHSGSQDSVWTMVYAGDDYPTSSQLAAPPPSRDDYSNIWQPSTPPPTRVTVSEQELASEPVMLSFPSPNSEFSDIAWTDTSSGLAFVSPHEDYFGQYSPVSTELIRYIYTSPTISPTVLSALSPTLWPTLSAPPPTSAHSPQQTQRSASASSSEVGSNAEFI
ncbi:hypothetical protein P171DRAFT_443767 [Karstenula rhodostoma CBS 690.94]|uniref:Uncharacterized protein n=1 Tax=Karstenula rhodostoma CBS 690.94 TaxID=1392251 RepID=A0A9P4PIQ8_9PLEO|nr:hypothetical protein P171DRAFT_443767 [Karstenula rhodostoma CBS 690.94]